MEKIRYCRAEVLHAQRHSLFGMEQLFVTSCQFLLPISDVRCPSFRWSCYRWDTSARVEHGFSVIGSPSLRYSLQFNKIDEKNVNLLDWRMDKKSSTRSDQIQIWYFNLLPTNLALNFANLSARCWFKFSGSVRVMWESILHTRILLLLEIFGHQALNEVLSALRSIPAKRTTTAIAQHF